MKKLVITLFMTLALAACTHTEIQNLGNDKYTLTSTAQYNENVTLSAINKSIDVCQKQNKRTITTGLESNYKSMDVPYGYIYKTVLTFECGKPLTNKPRS